MPFDSRPLRVNLSPRLTPLCRTGRGFLACEEDLALCETGLAAEILAAALRTSAVADIEEALWPAWEPDRVREEVDCLISRRVLIPEAAGDGASAWWDSLNCPRPTGKIGLVALWDGCTDLLAASLESCGFSITADAAVQVVITNDYLRPELASLSARSTPWLMVKPVGHTVSFGPVFRPGETPCWRCLSLRARPHRRLQAEFYGWSPDRLPPQPSVGCLPATVQLAVGFIANAMSLWAGRGGLPELDSTILSFDTRTLRQHRSILRRHPDCPQCGPSAEILVHLGPLHDFVSPITGIVSGIDVTSRPVGGFVHALARFAAPLPRNRVSRLIRDQFGVGKGGTPHEAETCAIAESLERYSMIYQGNERRVSAPIGSLDAIHPEDVLLFSDSQYLDRDRWNTSHSETQWVPERFDPAQAIDWTEAIPLDGGSARFVPAALAYMYYDFAGSGGSGAGFTGSVFCNGDSNGCAAGRTFEEALLGALLELIERDAVAIWWYNRLVRPTVNLSSLGDRRLLKAHADFRDEGRRLYIIDITADLGIPVYAALAPKFDGSEPCFAAAAAFSPAEAAWKAVSELSQICFWVSQQGGTRELLDWVRSTSVHNLPYLQGGPEAAAVPAAALTAAQALEACARQLTGNGLRAFYIDLTRPEVGVPVVRAIVPGLRHFWARLAPGRLYDVPAKMGWLERANAEEELNPVACMI